MGLSTLCLWDSLWGCWEKSPEVEGRSLFMLSCCLKTDWEHSDGTNGMLLYSHMLPLSKEHRKFLTDPILSLTVLWPSVSSSLKVRDECWWRWEVIFRKKQCVWTWCEEQGRWCLTIYFLKCQGQDFQVHRKCFAWITKSIVLLTNSWTLGIISVVELGKSPVR